MATRWIVQFIDPYIAIAARTRIARNHWRFPKTTHSNSVRSRNVAWHNACSFSFV
jgi:hypothetical protein